MSRKNDIIKKLEDYFLLIDGGESSFDHTYIYNHNIDGQVYPKFWSLSEVISYPTISFTLENENRLHLGGGFKEGFLNFDLRAYCRDEDLVIEELEDLIEDIEHILNNFSDSLSCVMDTIITEIGTDEGIMSPYGVARIGFTVRYQVETV